MGRHKLCSIKRIALIIDDFQIFVDVDTPNAMTKWTIEEEKNIEKFRKKVNDFRKKTVIEIESTNPPAMFHNSYEDCQNEILDHDFNADILTMGTS